MPSGSLEAKRPKRYRRMDGSSAPIRWPHRPRVNGEDVWGWTRPDTGVISVCANQSLQNQAMYLIHELCHEADPNATEEFVRRMTANFSGILSRNPGLAKWLVAALCGEVS